jgi:hypothetical protein
LCAADNSGGVFRENLFPSEIDIFSFLEHLISKATHAVFISLSHFMHLLWVLGGDGISLGFRAVQERCR